MLEFSSYSQAYQFIRARLEQLHLEVGHKQDLSDWEDLTRRLDESSQPTDQAAFYRFSFIEMQARKGLQAVVVLADQAHDPELRYAAVFILHGVWKYLEQTRSQKAWNYINALWGTKHASQTLGSEADVRALMSRAEPTKDQLEAVLDFLLSERIHSDELIPDVFYWVVADRFRSPFHHRAVLESQIILICYTSATVKDQLDWITFFFEMLLEEDAEIKRMVAKDVLMDLQAQVRPEFASALTGILQRHLDGPKTNGLDDGLEFYLSLVKGLKREEQNKILSWLWPHMGLSRIAFKSSGGATTFFPLFMESYVEQAPQAERGSIQKLTEFKVHRLTRGDFLAEQKLMANAFHQIHRSSVYQFADGRDLILKKVEGNNADETLWWESIRRAAIFPQGFLPEPVLDKEGFVQILELEDGSRVVPLITSHDYFYYLNEIEFPWDFFKSGLKKSVYTAFVLALRGALHMTPNQIYHSFYAAGSPQNRNYSWAPNIALRSNLGGMGALVNWETSLHYPNYGVSGLRDAEEFKTKEEVRKLNLTAVDAERISKSVSWPVQEMLILGSHLFSAGLLIGNRLSQEAREQKSDERELWKDDAFLQPFADLLLEVFSLAYAVRLNLDEKSALELMRPRVDWMRMVRQMAFFMTRAHAEYVNPNALPQNFPKEIFGETVRIETFGPYKPGSYDSVHGFIRDYSPTMKSLGNWNGPFPIRELEKAIYAVFLDADVVIPTEARNVGPYVMAHEGLVAQDMRVQALQAGGALLAGSQMIQTGALQVRTPVLAAPVEEDDSNRVLNLWRGLLFKTSDDLASRSPSPHRDELIRILNEIIKRDNAHEIQKLIESLQGNSLDVSSDGLIRLLEMRHLPNQPSLLARPVASKKNQWMGMPASPFQVTPSGTTPVASPVTVGH